MNRVRERSSLYHFCYEIRTRGSTVTWNPPACSMTARIPCKPRYQRYLDSEKAWVQNCRLCLKGTAFAYLRVQIPHPSPLGLVALGAVVIEPKLP
jgi:hypothetical protein